MTELTRIELRRQLLLREIERLTAKLQHLHIVVSTSDKYIPLISDIVVEIYTIHNDYKSTVEDYRIICTHELLNKGP